MASLCITLWGFFTIMHQYDVQRLRSKRTRDQSLISGKEKRTYRGLDEFLQTHFSLN